MTDDESLQFLEYLRQANHLTAAGSLDLYRNGRPQGKAHNKLWELTDLSAGEFASEAARRW